jgi:uncharacterized protein
MKHRCPICKAPTDSAAHPDFPFCSERCKTQDLGNWSSEKYVVSEPVFDLDELEGDAQRGAKQPGRGGDEDEDFKGFPKPNGTIH